MSEIDEFMMVGEVRNKIRDILDKNGMNMSISYGRIVVGRIQMKTTNVPMFISLYEDGV